MTTVEQAVEYDANTWRYEFRPNAKYPDLGLYSILAPNPDADKEGVVYSGKEIALADTDDREIAEQIVTNHNQHATLVEQRERLLRLLRPVTSPTACYCAVMKDEKCWHCEARELLATIEREGEAG